MFFAMKNGDLMGLDGDLSELLPSGKRLHNYGKSPCSTGKSTISMAIFNHKLLVYQRVHQPWILFMALWMFVG